MLKGSQCLLERMVLDKCMLLSHSWHLGKYVFLMYLQKMSAAEKYCTKINTLSTGDWLPWDKTYRTQAGVLQSYGTVRELSIGNATANILIANCKERWLLEQHLGVMPTLSSLAQGTFVLRKCCEQHPYSRTSGLNGTLPLRSLKGLHRSGV